MVSAQCGELLITNFIIFVVSRFRTNWLLQTIQENLSIWSPDTGKKVLSSLKKCHHLLTVWNGTLKICTECVLCPRYDVSEKSLY
jgi:hypothetical protein